jgi:hypothetical protein
LTGYAHLNRCSAEGFTPTILQTSLQLPKQAGVKGLQGFPLCQFFIGALSAAGVDPAMDAAIVLLSGRAAGG